MAACVAMSLLRRPPHLRAALIGVVVAVLALSGCSRVVDGHALIAGQRVGDPVAWEPCRFQSGAETRLPSGTECGAIAVPVDYSKPASGLTDIAMIKFPATGDKIGSLVINPGGPGESGIEAAVNQVGALPPQIRQHFDLVGFDPRGVGSSSPALWCNSDADNDRLRAEPQEAYTPEGVAHINKETKEFVQRCVDKMGKEFLANIGTASVVKDLDAIRAALGDDKLTYLGYSYGTRIGSAYAEQFPQNVRAMILDGAVDPNADPVEEDIKQAKAFQDAFDDFAADCAKDSACPLGTDPAKAVDVFLSMVQPLGTKSGPTKDPRGLSYSDAIVGTIMALYSPSLWNHLSDGLSELKQGRGDTMLALADMYMRRDSKGHYTNATDVRASVSCVDQPPLTDPAKVVDEDRRMREVAPFMSYGSFTGLAPMPTCSFWPVPPTSEPHSISAQDLPPTLVVSTTGDPATPYQAGVELSKELKGGLLTYQGTQHTVVFQGESCVDDYAAAYLLQGTIPPPDAKC
jgi:pimeloyl-ACP methyl ester carboxylesterase